MRLLRHLIFSLPLLFAGCATIHFENGEILPDPDTTPPWSINKLSLGLLGDDPTDRLDLSEGVRIHRSYHHAIFQIAELSNPLQLNKVCRGLDWNTVTTHVTPLDALLGLADNALLYNAGAPALDLWALWSVEYSCKP